MGLNFVTCIQCEINKAKDYTFTLLANFFLKQGEDVTPEELQLIKDVTKELVPDLPDSKIELVSIMLKELGPELEPQMIQSITAVAKEQDVSLTGHDVEVIAEMTRALGSELIQAQLEAVADLVSIFNLFNKHNFKQDRYNPD